MLLITSTAGKVFKYGVFSGPYFPVFGLNTGKYGPEKLRIWTLFTQWETYVFEREPFSFMKSYLSDEGVYSCNGNDKPQRVVEIISLKCSWKYLF